MPTAAISAAAKAPSSIKLPQVSIFFSHSGKLAGMTLGMSLSNSAGLSPIAQKNLHLASSSGGNFDKGLSSSGSPSTILAWSRALSREEGVTPL